MMALNIFKVGDRVKIIDGIAEVSDKDAPVIVEDGMKRMGGKLATVIEADYSDNTYRLDIDDTSKMTHLWWDFSWIKLYEDEEPKNKKKPRFEVGDYVRIKNISIDDDYPSGVTSDMLEFANKLARITDIHYYKWWGYYSYGIDLDDGKWDWDEDMFEYRLGNYEDNNIENHRFKYLIGYKLADGATIHTFNGFIENFAPCGKSVFVDKNGKTLVLPWEKIECIMPIDE